MKTKYILMGAGGLLVVMLLILQLWRPASVSNVAQPSRAVSPVDGPAMSPSQETHAAGDRPGPELAGGESASSVAHGDAPARPTIIVRTDVRRQSSREASIGLVLANANGKILRVTDVMQTQQPPPALRIVNEAGQVVEQGSFSYG